MPFVSAGWVLPRLLLWVLLLGLALPCDAANVLELDLAQVKRHDLNSETWVMADNSGQMDMVAVLAASEAGRFEQRLPQLGFTAAAIWLRWELRNRSLQNQTWWLGTGNRTLQEVDLYVPDAIGIYQHQSASSRLPFSQRPLPFANFVFPLELAPQQTAVVYLRVRSTGYLGVEVHPVLAAPSVLQQEALTEKIQWLIYLGMAATLALVNLVMGLYLKDKAYLLYVASIVVWAFAVSSVSGGYGAAYELLWPDSALFEQIAWVASTLVASVTVIYFVAFLLDLKIIAPRTTLWLWGSTACFAVAVTFQMAGAALQRDDLAALLQAAYLVGAVLYIIMSVLMWQGAYWAAVAGKRLAWYLMVANLPNTVYTVAVTMTATANRHAPDFGARFMWTSLFELFVMAFALADRFYQARAELLAARVSIGLRADKLALLEQLEDETRKAQAAQREAVQANLAKSKFLAAASHDLRQPIHALGLFLEVLSSTSLDEHQRTVLTHARSVYSTSSEMLNTLLDFSRIEAGVVDVQMGAFHLQPLLNKIELEMAPQADVKGLVYRTRETHYAVRSDPALLELIVRNLVSNAIRYTHAGGVLVACRRRGDMVSLEVWDTGIGIPVAQQQDIFQEFHQLGNPERDRNLGLGLGLAIVDGLVHKLGARISVASRPGRGSVFRVGLPSTTEVMLTDVFDPAPIREGTLRLRVLVIDDDETVRTGMLHLLGRWGCHVMAVESIEDALQAVRLQRPDVVISDYRLRQQHTGTEAIMAVRHELDDQVPALLITGDTAPERLREACASGIPLLHKPMAPGPLYRKLRELWRGR
jgi:signal transduction histidine kinase